jgi:hypothetical protein
VPNVSLPYTFVGGTAANAAEVNANLVALRDSINNNLIHRDGSKAMTALLSLISTDPSATTHATHKAYVDKQGLGKNLYFHSATLSAQNNASPTVFLDSGSIVTPSYAYNAYLLAFIMYKPSSDGHNYFKATDGTTTTSRVQNANGSSTRHSVFGMAGKWMAGGTMIAFQGNSASSVLRWRVWNENNDVFGTTDFTINCLTLVVPQ